MRPRPDHPLSLQVKTSGQPRRPEQVAEFLRRLSALKRSPEGVAQTQGARLEVLFQAIASATARQIAVPSPPTREVDFGRVASFLPDLRKGLATSRHDGRLLNVWAIAGLKRKEVPTAAVLGWILDCKGSHGFGSAIFEALLTILVAKYPSRDLQSVKLGRHYRLAVEHSSFGETSNRVDLVIDGENTVIFIEVKIDARQGENQLSNYLKLVKTRAAVQNKPTGWVLYLSSMLPDDAPDEVLHLRWKDVAKAIETAVPVMTENTVSGAVVRQFATHVKALH